MAKKKDTKFEEFIKKYEPVFGYEEFLKSHPKGKGDIQELIGAFIEEMKKEGAKEEDLSNLLPELQNRYMNGEREFFIQPVIKHYKESLEGLAQYANDNLEGIIDSSDESILRRRVLPYVAKKFRADNEKYKGLENILAEIEELEELMDKLQEQRTHREVVEKLRKEKEDYYRSAYADNEFVQRIFMSLIDDKILIGKKQKELKEKHDKLNELSDKDLKGYIKSAGLKKEDIFEMYIPVLKEAYSKKPSEPQYAQAA